MPGGMYDLMKKRYSQPTATDGLKATVKSEDQMREMDLASVATAIQGEIGNGWFNESESVNLDQAEEDSDKKGLTGILNWLTTTGGEDKASFIQNYVENLPMRAQLLAAYLVENGTSIDALQTDHKKLSETMTALGSYTPDYDKFVSKMTASKFKFWKYIAGNQIDWEKYSKAARFARRAVETEGVQTQQQEKGQKPAIPKGVVDRSKPILDMQRAFTEMSQKKDKGSTKIGEHRAKKSTDESGSTSGEQVPSEARKPVKPSQEALGTVVHDDPSKSSTTDHVNLGLTLGSTGGIALGTGVGTGGGQIAEWSGATEGAVGVTKSVGSSIGALGGVIGMAGSGLSAIQGTSDIINGSYTAPEVMERGLNVGANLAGVAKSGASVAVSIANAVSQASPVGSALQLGASAAATTAGVVAGGIGIGIGGLNALSGGVGLVSHVVHARNIQKNIEAYKASGKTAQEINEFEQISRVAMVSEKMAAVSSGFKAAAGAGQIAGGIVTVASGATGVGAIIGGIISGVSSALPLIGKIVNAIAFRGRKKEAVDRFINLKRMVAKLKANEATKDMKIDEDKVRLSFIQTLGYVSVDGMYDDLMWEFANLLYDHAVEGDDKDYIGLLSNIGLKVNKKSKKPAPAQIAKKLKG